jgi:hypothetical protein
MGERMTEWIIAGVVILLVVVTVLYLSMSAGRLDRLHQRIDTAELSLQTHLLRRSAATLELAASGVLDPATSVLLAERAHDARIASENGPNEVVWSAAESELTAALNAAFDDVDEVEAVAAIELGDALLWELTASCQRVALSRRFHNDAVRACRQVRAQNVVRIFRLAGHTALPQTWEMDDAIQDGFVAWAEQTPPRGVPGGGLR